MRLIAVAATHRELRPTMGRALWDRELMYRSMIRWGQGSVVPIDGRVRWRRAVGTLARGASKTADRSLHWRSSAPRRWLRDVAQIERVVVPSHVGAAYGHISYPIARGRPTLWSTAGVLDARPGEWFPAQSVRTHERLMAMAAATQCWSELGRRGLLERTDRVTSERLHVVPPLVYVDLPSPWERPDGDLVAIFIGAFGRLKGLPVLLDAMRGIGSGLRLEVITADAAPAELPSSVDWLGARPRQEVLSRLMSADIHVFPSRTESFGGVVVEALAAGTPQVVDASGVPAEIVGEAGVVVPGQDSAAIKDALDRLAADADLRDRLRRASLTRYRERYAPEVVGAHLAAIIDGM